MKVTPIRLFLTVFLLLSNATAQDSVTGEFEPRAWDCAKGRKGILLDDLGWGAQLRVQGMPEAVKVPHKLLSAEDLRYLEEKWKLAKPRAIVGFGPTASEIIEQSFQNPLWRLITRESRGEGEFPDLQLIIRKSDPRRPAADHDVLLVQPEGFGLIWWHRALDPTKGRTPSVHELPLEGVTNLTREDIDTARKKHFQIQENQFLQAQIAPIAAKLDLAIYEVLGRLGAWRELSDAIETADFKNGPRVQLRRLLLAAGTAREFSEGAKRRLIALLRTEEFGLEAAWALAHSASAEEDAVRTAVWKQAENWLNDGAAIGRLVKARAEDPELWRMMEVESSAQISNILTVAQLRARPGKDFKLEGTLDYKLLGGVYHPRVADRLSDRTLKREDQLRSRIIGILTRAQEPAGLRDLLFTIENPDRFSSRAIDAALKEIRGYRREFIDQTDGILKTNSTSLFSIERIFNPRTEAEMDAEVAMNPPFAYESRIAAAAIPLIGNEESRLETAAGRILMALGIGGVEALPAMIRRMEELYRTQPVEGKDPVFSRRGRYQAYLDATYVILRMTRARSELFESIFEPPEIQEMARNLANQIDPEDDEYWEKIAVSLESLGGHAFVAVGNLQILPGTEDEETRAAIDSAIRRISVEHQAIVAADTPPKIDTSQLRLRFAARKKPQSRKRIAFSGINSMRATHRHWVYEVEIENGSQNPVKNLEVHYRVFRSTGEFVEEYRVLPLIDRLRSVKFDTHSGETLERARGVTRQSIYSAIGVTILHDAESFSYTRGGTLAGIWIRCSIGGKQVAEFRKLPTRLKDETWSEGEKLIR